MPENRIQLELQHNGASSGWWRMISLRRAGRSLITPVRR